MPERGRKAKVFCGANKRGGRGKCRRVPLKGAKRCKLHGGLQQVPEGSRPGAKRPRGNLKHGLYSKKFKLPGMLEDFQEADALTGTLDQELRVARSYLAWSIKRHQADPEGGVVVSVGEHGQKIRAYADLVQEYGDRVRALEATRSKMVVEGKGDEVRSAIVDLVRGLRDGPQED